MREDTCNHWKLSNLGTVADSGIMRTQADSRYKGECIYSPEYNSPTIRCIGGGGL